MTLKIKFERIEDMLIDTHCHMNFRAYDDDREEVIQRSLDAGIGMINVGTNFQTSLDAIQVAEKHNMSWASVGMHPFHLFPYPTDEQEEATQSVEGFDVEKYRELAKHEKVIAIGECGIDLYRIPDGFTQQEVEEKQEAAFRQHLDLADELGLPVIVHCRDGHEQVFQILKEYTDAGKLKSKGVIHCFTGTKEEALKYLPLGFLISFTGIITFPPRKNQTEILADVVRAIPLNKIMAETDAPYLAPEPFRGKRCEPAHVKNVAEKIAEIKNQPFETVVEQTTKNAKELFRLT